MKTPGQEDERFFQSIETFLRTTAKDKSGSFIPSEADILRFVEREARLIQLMRQEASDEQPFFSSDLPLFSEVISGGRKLTLGVFSGDIPSELEIDNVGLHFFEGQPIPHPFTAPYAPAIFEADTPVVLSIGKHMDQQTAPQVEQLLAGDQIMRSALQTLYIINPNRESQNRIGKISVFPRRIIDARPEVSDKEMTLKHVITSVVGADVALIDQGLTILETAYF